jgi:hypothetical protein
MHNDELIAFFITWTVYGTRLQGDKRGWRRRKNGEQTPQPRLAQWRRDRLKHSIGLLNSELRETVNSEIGRLCRYRRWHSWTHDARSNHVHVVVTAVRYSGKQVRDQLKANCTRVLRESWAEFIDRPVWTSGGDWQCINTEEELHDVVQYVREAQDRMQFKDG